MACTAPEPNAADGGRRDADVSDAAVSDAGDAGRALDGGDAGRGPDGGDAGSSCPVTGYTECDPAREPCETYTWADEAHCGGCTASCPAEQLCIAGACGVPLLADAALGSGHSCVRTSARHVLCWGSNRIGQLGDGTSDPDQVMLQRPDPVAVLELADAEQIASLDETTCAVRGAERAVYCWGHNTEDRFGDPDAEPICGACTRPVRLLGTSSPIREVDVGGVHVCVRTDDAVLCSGNNAGGALGLADEDVRTPTLVPMPLPAGTPLEIATGGFAGFGHTCVLMSGGDVYCTGTNDAGQCGTAPGAESWSLYGLTRVTGLGDVVHIYAGRAFTCALEREGELQCWGYNGAGQLGRGFVDSSYDAMPAPADVPALSAVALGPDYVIAVTDPPSQVYAWGAAGDGQLGRGAGSGLLDTGAPTLVLAGTSTYRPFAGGSHACILEHPEAGDPLLLCAGNNSYYELGHTGGRVTRFERVASLTP